MDEVENLKFGFVIKRCSLPNREGEKGRGFDK
jgi:hypothetical protein